MTPRLDLIFIKVERAEEHVRNLERLVSAFLDGPPSPYEIGTKDDPNAGETVYYVTSIRDVPLKFAAVTGDALQNLRSALDHLAWQLVDAAGAIGDTSTSFPIADSAAKYMSPQFRRKVKGMRKDAIDAIDAIKPYKGGNDVLWRLHELNNIDKHRLVMTVASTNPYHSVLPATATEMRRIWAGSHPSEPFPLASLNNVMQRSTALHFPLKAGDKLISLPRDSELNKQVKFTFDVAFSEAHVIKGEPLLDTLRKMHKTVTDIVFGFRPML